LLATTALLAMCAASQAAIISNLGIDPTSATGTFQNSVFGATFEDQYTFQLVGGPQFFTIASATNVFPRTTDFISNFTGAVFTTGADGIVNNADDVLVLGPATSFSCPFQPNCQGLAGSAVLNAGNYYLEISGTGAGTSGYGGNIATSPLAVPGPKVGSFTLGSLLALLK
jgi:hypothetical protein